MTQYVSPEIEQNPTAIQQQMVDDLADNGVDVRPATALYYLLGIFAFLWAQLAEQTSQVFNTIFRYFGQKIARIPPNDAAAASTTVTFTAVDTAGPYLIPAGTEVNLRSADGTVIPFRTTIDQTIPNGDTEITPVIIVAAAGGTAGNDLSTFDSLTQTFTWAGSPAVTVLAPTSGGTDAETDDEYQDRAAELLTLPLRTLVRSENFEVYARSIPGVDRARAIPNYLPSPPSAVAFGHITTALIDEDGEPVGPTVKAAVLSGMQGLSLTNLIPHVIDATYTPITVVFEAVTKAGYDPDEVNAAAEDAVRTFLSPAAWGRAEGGDNREWQQFDYVRFQDVSTVLNNTLGFDHWTVLTINSATVDVTLLQPAGLPDPASTVSGDMVAP